MDKTQILRAYPEIPSEAELRVLLWDDPLFNPDFEQEKRLLDDSQAIETQRRARLEALCLLYRQLSLFRMPRSFAR